MGKATTKLFEGIMAKHAARARRRRSTSPTSGTIILMLIGLYVVSALFSYLQQYIMAGVAQKTVYDMRQDVNEKLARLPLKYFDSRTHGEILSRVTNDMDNISQHPAAEPDPAHHLRRDHRRRHRHDAHHQPAADPDRLVDAAAVASS